MTAYQFAKEYLQWQDEIKCTTENIELLAEAIAVAGINIENITEENQHEILDHLNELADKVCKCIKIGRLG